MVLDFRNVNTLWASVLVQTLASLGLKAAIVCPGSRSTPLTVAFAQHPKIEAIPILDERSASFFALGMARKLHEPLVLVCTSGTAGANFYPAVIEARESRVPLLVLTADRPPELRDCNAGQAIDQQKLFGTYPNFYSEIAVPSLDWSMLAYLRQTTLQAWQQALYPIPGVVHLNLPFREPLAPIEQPEAKALADEFPDDFFSSIDFAKGLTEANSVEATCYDEESWVPPKSPILGDFENEKFGVSKSPTRGGFRGLQPLTTKQSPSLIRLRSRTHLELPPLSDRGIIIAGVAQPEDPQRYCAAIANLSKSLGMPVLAEGLSPLRNYASLNPYLISTYDSILRNRELATKLAPEIVIRIGEMPTSKELRLWLDATKPTQIVIDPSDRSLDPLHGKTIHLQGSIESLILSSKSPRNRELENSYCSQWLMAESETRSTIDKTLESETDFFEGKVAWLLSQMLPEGTPLFIASSMPVRDVEFFWQPNDRHIQPFFNRGANGIDGTLSTAMGIAHRNQSSVMLTGDLSLLHDTNGFLNRTRFVGHLTIVLINNNGGGIFGMLPIAPFDPPFEEFFATPQNIDFAKLCQTYEVEHELIESWNHLVARLNPLPTEGIRVLEIKTDRHHDAQWRKNNLGKFAQLIHL